MRRSLFSFAIIGILGCNHKGSLSLNESTEADTSGGTDADHDGYTADVDCDDEDAAIYPGAPDICDGLDNNCDGQVDEDGTTSWYTDADGDGYGDDSTAVLSCEQPAGTVAQGGDCNDADAAYHPGAPETDCTDLNDYNCDGSTGVTDADGDGFSACSECDDADASINPDATEICDGVDNNCDGSIDGADAADASTWYTDSDGDGYGDPSTAVIACDAPAGTVADGSDCNDSDVAVSPGASEVCNGIDDNCNDRVDEGAPGGTTWYADGDGDGYGDASVSETSCAQPDGYVADDTDCDISNAAINPGATEVCDGVDNNCDGQIDENGAADGTTYYTDADGDGYGDPSTAVKACSKPVGAVANNTDCDDTDIAVNIDAVEVCDDIDNDCDGSVDWGLRVPTDYSAIQDAIKASVTGDTVCVAPGTYVEQIDYSGKGITVEGTSGSASTTIDGDGGSVVTFSDYETSAAVLQGFTITGGTYESGAGVYINEASPTLIDLVISGNTCSSGPCRGVGVFAYNSNSTMENLVISGNSCSSITGCAGGGIYAKDSDISLTSATISDNEFTGGGGSYYYYGAGAYLVETNAVFQDVDVTGNSIALTGSSSYQTGYGAGIESTENGSLEFDGGSIAGNTVDLSAHPRSPGGGGALFAYYNADVTITEAWIVDNAVSTTYTGVGGAGYLLANATVSLTNTIVANNALTDTDTSKYSVYGGGFYLADHSDLNLQNVDLVGNSVTASEPFGGAVAVDAYCSLESVNTNFVSNIISTTSGFGGAISTLSGVGTSMDISYSNIYGNTTREVYGVSSPVGSDGNVSVDPVYTDTSATDALDWDLSLSAGSACIDAGDPSISDADGTASDIGAYGGPAGSGW